MSEQFHWSESAGRYVPNLAANRRYFGNVAYLIALGVPEEQVTGELADCGVGYLTRYAMLQSPAADRSRIRHSVDVEAEAESRSPVPCPDPPVPQGQIVNNEI